jgi:hypothetical protein
MSTATKTYVRYFTPGTIVSNEGVREVPERNPYQIARDLPSGAFAFEFFDKLVAVGEEGGQEVALTSGERNKSGRFYIDAEKLTATDVEALPGDHSILLDNMRGNRWPAVLRCRTGNFQPMQAGDSIITLRETAR